MKNSKKVSQLKVGDILSPTKAEVIKAPYDSIHVPKGKVFLVVKYPNKEPIRVTWGKRTTVSILVSFLLFLFVGMSSALAQDTTQVKSDVVQLYELAAADGKITKKELKLIRQLTENDSNGFKFRKGHKYRKDLDPSVYITRGLEHGYKMTLWKVQSRIIDDINDITNEMLRKR